jgi:hypothetical protein
MRGPVLAALVSACAQQSPPPRAAIAVPEVVRIGPVAERPAPQKREPTGCKAGLALYIVNSEGELFLFDSAPVSPAQVVFHPFARVECRGCAVNNMTIEMDGTLWVGLRGGSLCRTTLAAPKCDSSNTRTALLDGRVFGMTWQGGRLFASDYVEDGVQSTQRSALWSMDRAFTTSYQGPPKSKVGEYTDGLRGLAGDLATDDAGKLFGLFNAQTFVFSEIDPATAATPKRGQIIIQEEPGTEPAQNWTLAHWDGMFWIFVGERLWHLRYGVDPAPTLVASALEVLPTGASRGPCVERSLLSEHSDRAAVH